MTLFGLHFWGRRDDDWAASKELEHEWERATGGRFSRGNIPVQDGSFVTTEDLERERAEIRNYKFNK